MKKLKSFTLIELVLYIALSGTIVFSITVLAVMSLQIREKNKAILEVENQGASILEKLSYQVRNASDITIPLPTASSGNMTLQVDEASKNPTVFSVIDNRLQIKQGANLAQDLNSSNILISGLSFSNLSTGTEKPDEIKITFTLTYDINDIKYEKKFYGAASQRNTP